MKSPTRKEIFEQAANRLRAAFEELRVVPHAAAKGAEGEVILRTFLNDHLPQRFKAGAGFIIDQKDNVSKQTDVVIYDAMNCPVYRASEQAAIFPADNVAVVVEVKSSLTKERLDDAAENIALAKSLWKTQASEWPFFVETRTVGCVFAFKSPLNLATLSDHFQDTILEKARNIARSIDLVVVLDVGILSLVVYKPSQSGWAPLLLERMQGPPIEGSHIGVAAAPHGAATLDVFLRMLLTHLNQFRGMVDHPGFPWPTLIDMEPRISYLTSVSHEEDPVERERKQALYRQQAIAIFAGAPAPADWPGKRGE